MADERMNVDVYDITIAALLHDIGKVMQRAEIDIDKNKYLMRCPYKADQNRNSHLHVMWTELFFDSFPVDYPNWQLITNLAASHHKIEAFEPQEDNWLVKCISYADRVASSWDRKEADEYQRDLYKKRPLYSIFNSISDKNSGQFQPFRYRLPLIPLSKLSETMMDGRFFPEAEETTLKCKEYQALYESFVSEYKILQNAVNINRIGKIQFLEALDSLLEQYFWCVPANTCEANPTNSLYHHSRVTAGIAAVLYNIYHKQPEILNEKIINDEQKRFVLIGGDLSGIQNYIFDLNPEHSSKVSKTLRSRSFKVKILMEIALINILEELALPSQTVLMNAGGKFMILAALNNDSKEKMKVIKGEIDEYFFREFQGVLNLNLDWNTEVSFAALKRDNFQKTIELFIANLDLAKKRKFSSYLQADCKWLTNNMIIESIMHPDDICPLCYRQPGTERGHEFDGLICKRCQQEIDLGQNLPKYRFAEITSIKPDKYQLCLADKYYFKLLKVNELPDRISGRKHVFRFNSTPIDSDELPDKNKEDSLAPLKYQANFLPVYEQNQEKDYLLLGSGGTNYLTLDEIARFALKPIDDKHCKGSPYNAVIKGDVDNLGQLFSHYLKDKNGCYSITDYATFSQSIDFFFSCYLVELIRTRYSKIYIIYSGGDDFVLVGPWNMIIEFSRCLEQDFRTFVQNNPALHFSAGINLMHGKSPIKAAVTQADELLITAKGKTDKNSVSVLDITVSWPEFGKLLEWSDKFDKWLNEDAEKQFTTQFLYRLFHYSNMARRFRQEGKADDLMYQSYFNYDLKRNISDENIKKQFYELLDEQDILVNLSLPLHITLYNNRKKEEK